MNHTFWTHTAVHALNDVTALLTDHHATVMYAAPLLYIGVFTLVVKWVLRGPRDLIIDIHYLPETFRLTGWTAHQADMRSRLC